MTVVKPWYRQFYLLRGEAEWTSDRVSPGAYESCLEAIDGFVYVGTSMYGHPTDVRVEVHDTEQAFAVACHAPVGGATDD